MKLMIFDTETADKLENSDKSILVKIGYMFYNIDKNLFFFESEYIKPEIPMSPSASAVNHITNIDVGLEPDIDGVLRDVPTPFESNVLKRFIGGIKKYENDKDFYVVGFNIDSFDIEVINRAVKNNVFDKVNRIDLYRVAKYLYFTDEGRKIVKKDFNPKIDLPESLSLQYLKYFLKLYRNKEKLKQSGILQSNSNIKSFDISHDAISDVIDTLILLKFFEKKFQLSLERMKEISNNSIILDYFNYGYLRGERIDSVESNKLLNIINRNNDKDLVESIIRELIINRKEPVEVVFEACKGLYEDIVNKVLKNNNQQQNNNQQVQTTTQNLKVELNREVETKKEKKRRKDKKIKLFESI